MTLPVVAMSALLAHQRILTALIILRSPVSGHTRGALKIEGWVLTPIFCFHLRELGRIATHIFSFCRSVCCLILQLISLFMKCKSSLTFCVRQMTGGRSGGTSPFLAQDSVDFSPLRFGRNVGGTLLQWAGVQS